ncbi:MAG: outer rane autotransporter barrel domain protein, partial [Deltaproteobacteria bacterium]|nr:outer rane autotransporter barrel domain protein [Deltaproteobacteria bacterium]
SQVTQNITVERLNQTIGTISFSTSSLRVGSTTTASATATSALTVTFSSLTTGVCTVSGPNGATVTGLTEGICTIAADQPGDTIYSAAPQVSEHITSAVYPVKVDSSGEYKLTLQYVYDAAAATDIIKTAATTLVTNFSAHLPVNVTLMGGYTDEAFSIRTGSSTTVIDGSLKISGGTLRVERIVVR